MVRPCPVKWFGIWRQVTGSHLLEVRSGFIAVLETENKEGAEA